MNVKKKSQSAYFNMWQKMIYFLVLSYGRRNSNGKSNLYLYRVKKKTNNQVSEELWRKETKLWYWCKNQTLKRKIHTIQQYILMQGRKVPFLLEPTLHPLNALINIFMSLYIKVWGTNSNNFYKDKIMIFGFGFFFGGQTQIHKNQKILM